MSVKPADICGVVVSMNPDHQFKDRLERLRRLTDSVVVVDNGSDVTCRDQLHAVCESLGVHLIENNKNLGLGAALNQGMSFAIENGYDWALTMDQDSELSGELLVTYNQIIDDWDDGARLAVLGSNYICPRTGVFFNSKKAELSKVWTEPVAVIISGSLFNIDLFESTGPFREELFVDGIDFDYCIRARSKGYGVVMSMKPLIRHCVGEPVLHSSTGIVSYNHPAIRCYYKTRNYITLAKENLRNEPYWVLTSLLFWLFWYPVTVALFEPDKLSKLKESLKGAKDGIKGALGGRPTL